MIVYKELSSLELDLGFSARTLYSVSNCIEKHYHKAKIPKGNGEFRELLIPDELLKSIQRSIAVNLLPLEEVSKYAMAYWYGGSTISNARPHVGQPMLLKLDIRHFFEHITFSQVKEKAFPEFRYSEANRILLSVLCVYTHTIPQGAPTSPAISNIIMKEFDEKVGKWCESRGIMYTRYCDDMTFSGTFVPKEVISFVQDQLRVEGFFLNKKKTTFVKNGQRKSVTGIIVNDKLSVPATYRRQIRQELYYCKKYGVESHMKRSGIPETKEKYLRQLLGRINYALAVAGNEEIRSEREWIQKQLTNS